MTALIFIVCAYLIGSLSFAVLSSRLFNLPDPRTYGSKNPGATNVLRSGKKSAAAVTLFGDGVKGWLAVWLAKYYAPHFDFDALVIATAALAVFLGHLFPIFFKFKGGKGVATAFGILLALNYWIALGVLIIWLLVFLIWRYSSLGALVAAMCAPIFTGVILGWNIYFFSVLAIAVLIVWRHKSNIKNLFTGTERKSA